MSIIPIDLTKEELVDRKREIASMVDNFRNQIIVLEHEASYINGALALYARLEIELEKENRNAT